MFKFIRFPMSLVPALLSGIFALPALAQVATASISTKPVYHPIVWTDASNGSQQSLRARADSFSKPLHTADATFTTLRVQNTDLSFFPEIALLLQNAAQPTVSRTRAGGPPECAVISSNTCHLDQTELTVLAQAAVACREILVPESFILNQLHNGVAPGVPKASDLNSIEALIAVAGLPLMQIDLPGNFIATDAGDRMRQILLKIRASQLQNQARDAADALEKIYIALNIRTGCNGEDRSSLQASLTAQIETIHRAADKVASVNASGLRQAATERATLESRGHFRAQLEFPSLTDSERELLSMTLIGTYWRMRGGALIRMPGTQQARELFASVPFQLIARLNAGDALADSEIKALGQAQRWALVWRGWGNFQSMGNVAGQGDLYHNLIGMTDRGAYQTSAGALILKRNGFESEMFEVGGLQMGACYFYSRWQPVSVTLGLKHEVETALRVPPGQQNPYEFFIDNSTSWGEFCSGAAMGLGLSRALLEGRAAPR